MIQRQRDWKRLVSLVLKTFDITLYGLRFEVSGPGVSTAPEPWPRAAARVSGGDLGLES